MSRFHSNQTKKRDVCFQPYSSSVLSVVLLDVYLCVCVMAGGRGHVGKQQPDVPGPHTRSSAFMADLFVIMAFKRSRVD